MDREFMKTFLNKYYMDYQSESVKDSEEYQERRKRRYEIEKKFELLLQESSKELVELFEVYLDFCAIVKYVLTDHLLKRYFMGK